MPIVQGFLLCEQVLRDVRTGKFLLDGPTTHFRVTDFPARLKVTGFLQMVEGHGDYHFAATLFDPDEEAVWNWTADRPLSHPEPLFAHQIVFDWVLPLPRPGRYRLGVRANGEELLSQSVFMGTAELLRAVQ
jgi:hypothetical protein